MKFLISGYGAEGEKNLRVCDENGNFIWSDTVESPSFVTVKGDRMFAVTENSGFSLIHSYQREGDGFCRVDTARFMGRDLCHVCYSPKNRMVFGACWGSGHLVYATLDEEGHFLDTHCVLQRKETADEDVQTRVHSCYVDKAEKILTVCNVGLDIIYFYEIGDGTLREIDRIRTEKGQHPRHAVYSADERRLYVITELSNEVLVYAMPEKKLLQRISTLPQGFSGKSHCSAVCLSPDEKTLYGANRYSETLVFFKTDGDGLLTLARRIPCTGEKPRHMILSEYGKLLIVLYQVSGEVCLMPLGEDGLPIEGAERKIPFPGAACAAQLD